MEPRERGPRDREWRNQMAATLPLLGEYPRRLSDFLYVSLLTEEEYPELSATLEQMALRELRCFRLLGGLLMRQGFDPPIGRLLGLGGSYRPPVIREGSVGTVLRALQRNTEALRSASYRVLTAPEWEEEDGVTALLEEQEQQLLALERMLS